MTSATGDALSTVEANNLIGYDLGNRAYTPPANYYVARYTTAPTDAGGGIEVAVTRLVVANNTTNFGVPATGQVTLLTVLTWPIATSNEGTTVAIGLHGASSGDDLRWWTLVANKVVNSGQQAEYAANSLTFKMT